MPNAAEYRAAAHRYRRLGENYLRQAALVTRSRVDSHLGSGPVAVAVADALRSVASHLTVASNEMARLAGICDARAAVCDEYARRLREHRAAAPFPWSPTRLPAPPYPWVDAA